jgi:poly-gamma-glutamate synthesis protein (capsule biosynthesis protein)
VLIDRELEAITERVALLESRPEPEPRKLKAQLKLERKTLASRLATQQHRRERILKMLPEGFQVASPALRMREPSQGTVAVQGPP